MKLHRRQMLLGLGGAALAATSVRSIAQASILFGPHVLTSVSDGHLVLPGTFFFDGLPQDEVESILSRHGLSADQLEPPCNLTLLQSGDYTVLFDAGAGSGFVPSAGRMLDSLAALDVAPEDITHVVLTHAHPDHLWGVLDDFDDPVFANATVMIGQNEWTYWTDPDTVNTIGDARASFAVGAARRLEAIAPQIQTFQGGAELLPGVLAHGTPGHTPGHMSFEIRDGSRAVMIGGDAIGNAHVAFARPAWPSGADQDREQAARTRVRLLDQLAADEIMLMGFHLPHGGFGRVERANGAYRFTQEDV